MRHILIPNAENRSQYLRSVSLVAPAATYWLAETVSKDSLRNHLGNHNLDLCMLFLTEVEDSYPAATIIHKLFSSARGSDNSIQGHLS